MSANEEVRSDVVTLRRIITILQVLPLKLFRCTVEEINIVLNYILGIGELLVNRVRTNIVIILIVLTIADEVDLFLGGLIKLPEKQTEA